MKIQFLDTKTVVISRSDLRATGLASSIMMEYLGLTWSNLWFWVLQTAV